jgi:hypothetical protein
MNDNFGFQSGGGGGGGGGTTITTVANYSALPAANTVSGKFYWCEASQGTKWLPFSVGGTYYNSGMYYSNGTTWEYSETPYQATQSEVNTGTNTDKFVSPSTLTNANVITNKVPYTGATQDTDLGNYSLNAKSLHVKGTGGAGHLGLKHQSANITASASESSIGANSLGNPVWKNDGNPIENILLQSNITQTITSGVTDKAPSEDAVFDALNLKAGNLIAKQNTTISHTGTTAETKLYSVLIPDGTMNVNDILRIFAKIYGNNSGNNKTIKMYFNTSDNIGGTQFATYIFSTAAFSFCRNIFFKNSLSSQEVSNSAIVSIASDEAGTNFVLTSLISADFNNDVWFVISITLANSSDTVKIYGITAEIKR